MDKGKKVEPSIEEDRSEPSIQEHHQDHEIDGHAPLRGQNMLGP
jgi:hypothetical protein